MLLRACRQNPRRIRGQANQQALAKVYARATLAEAIRAKGLTQDQARRPRRPLARRHQPYMVSLAAGSITRHSEIGWLPS